MIEIRFPLVMLFERENGGSRVDRSSKRSNLRETIEGGFAAM